MPRAKALLAFSDGYKDLRETGDLQYISAYTDQKFG
jgi:hypothetical protein